jgi:hypothetical protein
MKANFFPDAGNRGTQAHSRELPRTECVFKMSKLMPPNTIENSNRFCEEVSDRFIYSTAFMRICRGDYCASCPAR